MTPSTPDTISTEAELDDHLARPSPKVLEVLQTLSSDLLILGVGGKMGPTLARMAARALAEIGSSRRVVGVARFSRPGLREQLESWGVQTIACDLLDRAALAHLPDSQNLIFMAGQKFGTAGNEPLTWAMNTYLPTLVAERFSRARMVVFSTGNVYPLSPMGAGGSQENDPVAPIGEYAQSCLGRERMIQYASQQHGLRAAIIRLNYAIDLRYGVLLDTAQKVDQGQPIDLSMGAVNVIWQGDANAQGLALLAHCASPPLILNVTGPETISIRRLAEQFGERLGKTPIFQGEEALTALLNNAARAQHLFGYPRVTLNQLIDWTVHWIQIEGPTLNKPTHFETRDGRF